MSPSITFCNVSILHKKNDKIILDKKFKRNEKDKKSRKENQKIQKTNNKKRQIQE